MENQFIKKEIHLLAPFVSFAVQLHQGATECDQQKFDQFSFSSCEIRWRVSWFDLPGNAGMIPCGNSSEFNSS